MRQKAFLRNFLLSAVVLHGLAIFLNTPGIYSLKTESSVHRISVYEDVNNEMSLFQQKNNVTKNSSADSGVKEAVVSIQGAQTPTTTPTTTTITWTIMSILNYGIGTRPTT